MCSLVRMWDLCNIPFGQAASGLGKMLAFVVKCLLVVGMIVLDNTLGVARVEDFR